MANQEAYKIPVNRLRFDEATKYRHSSIKALGLAPEIARSDKTIRRYLRDGKMPPELLDRIAKYLDISPDYISGQRDRDIDKIQDADLREILRRSLRVERYPYLSKPQANIYDRYYESLFTVHGISMRQFNELSWEQQKKLQLDIEDAIIPVLLRHFEYDAKGQKGLPDIGHLVSDIDNYNPDEPDDL